MKTASPSSISISSWLWDLFCTASLIGIWPRFIEPKTLTTSYLNFNYKGLHPDLQGLTILQFSDLHLHSGVSDRFLLKLKKRIQELRPDLIVFTGDLLCHARLLQPERLKQFLQALQAPYGCFGVFGNHDYSEYVSLTEKGEFDIPEPKGNFFLKTFKRFFWKTMDQPAPSARAQAVPSHEALSKLLKETSFQFLENSTQQIAIGNAAINLCGLGEYWLGRCKPEEAYANYDPNHPGIVLCHNPDAIPKLLHYPGELILCGHTHGGQVNLPWIWKKLTTMEHPQFKRGHVRIHSKEVYVNRGVSSTQLFRWFSPPEILLITLGEVP